jgi:hypothetical protein
LLLLLLLPLQTGCFHNAAFAKGRLRFVMQGRCFDFTFFVAS